MRILGQAPPAKNRVAGAVEPAAVRPRKPIAVELEVAPVGRERVRGQAIFDPQRVDEAIDRGLAGPPDLLHPNDQSSLSFCSVTTFL